MGEYLPFVTIDTWTMIFTLVNLVVLFLLLKKFLFKPVNKMLDARKEEIENSYKQAEDAKAEAEGIKDEYEQKLMGAKDEADKIIKSAVEKASMRSDSIIDDANNEARNIIEKSQKQIEQEKRTAMKEAQEDIASMAVEVAEKLISKKLNSSDDEKLISDIIDRI